MKIIKSLFALLMIPVLALSVTSCGEGDDVKNDETPISVAFLKGPTGVGAAGLMKENEDGNTAEKYDIILASAADEISGKLVSGEINIASVPTNLAAKLYNKTGGKIVMLAANTLSVLSVVENGDSIKTFADLKGKTVYSTGEGSNPEYIIRFLLTKNGIDPDRDVDLKFVATGDELAAQIISGNAEAAVVPEPVATTVLMKKPTLRRALTLYDEWNDKASGEIVMGCTVALRSFAEGNGNAVENFLKDYENSVIFAINDTASAAALCEKYGIIPSSDTAEKSIPYCGLTFMRGKDAKPFAEPYFEVLKSYDASSLGGDLPDENFYY